MNHNEFASIVEKQIQTCLHLLDAKSHEYTGDKESVNHDKLHNFKLASAISETTYEQALWGMLVKHLVSVHDLIERQAKGEVIPLTTWTEKITDCINYLLILRTMVETSQK